MSLLFDSDDEGANNTNTATTTTTQAPKSGAKSAPRFKAPPPPQTTDSNASATVPTPNFLDNNNENTNVASSSHVDPMTTTSNENDNDNNNNTSTENQQQQAPPPPTALQPDSMITPATTGDATSAPTFIPASGSMESTSAASTPLAGAPDSRPSNLPVQSWTDNNNGSSGNNNGTDSNAPSTLFRPDQDQMQQQQHDAAGLPVAQWSVPTISGTSTAAATAAAAPLQTTFNSSQGMQMPNAPDVPIPVVIAPDPPLSLQLPPPVQVPASETAPSQVLKETAAMTPAWDAFDGLRKTLDESHQRLLTIHSEISRSQVSHEEEAENYRSVTEAQLDAQRKEIQSLTDKYNQTQANLDHVSGVLVRKSQEIMELEQKLHDAACQKASVVQKAAHTEDKAKLAEKLRMAAEVRATELQLSLDHATALLTSMRKQLNSANDDKTAALQRQYQLFEENRQAIIQFYSERERYVLASFNDSVQKSQAQLMERERAREQQVIAHWQNVSRAQVEELQSLVAENKKRADDHAVEIIALKEKQEGEKNRWLLHLQNEIKLADERAAEREKNLVADLTKREREMSEREQKMRVQFAQAEQEAKLQLITREAELKATYDKLLEDLRQAYDSDREKTVTGFREQLASIASQHLQNERELEKMHREKEREMGQRYRIAGYDAEDQKQKSELDTVTNKTTGTLLAKFEQFEIRDKERADASRSRMLSSTAPGSGAPGSSSTASKYPLPSALTSSASSGSSSSSSGIKGSLSNISGFSSSSTTTTAPTTSSSTKPSESK